MSHLEANLLAYLDGELSPADNKAAEVHLSRCQACAAELAELQALRAGLADVVPAAYEVVRIPPQAEARIRRALAAERARQEQAGLLQQWWDSLVAGLQAVLSPMSKAAVPLVAVIFLVLSANAGRLPLQTGVQETLVLGQDTFTPGTESAVRVLVRDGESGQPIANANVAVQLRRPKVGLARTVYTGQTDATGSAPVRFSVPEDWEGEAELVVEARSRLGDDRVVEPIRLDRSYRLLLSSDKPVYQPGETIHLRTLALGKVDGRPAVGTVSRFEVFDPAGQPLLVEEIPSSQFGIAAVDLALDEQAPQGRYQLQATLGDTTSQLSVQVSQAEPPSFRVDVEADTPYYLPGDPLTGQVSASYFFGKPVARGAVIVRLVGRPGATAGITPPSGEEERLFLQELRGQTDEAGRYAFQFTLPDLPQSAFGDDSTLPLDLEATVADLSGKSELAWQPLTLARQPILIDVVAEGGTLRTGVENILYVLTSYPDGQPVAASLTVQIGTGPAIDAVATDFGLAQVRYTPRAGDVGARQVRVTASDAAGRVGTATVTLPLNEARETLLLRTDRALYRVGDTLAIEALASGAGKTVYLDVIKGGQTLLTQSALIEQGRATLGIDLTPDLAGTLELRAYQVTADNAILRDTRVVVVDEPESLQIALATDQPQYRPRQKAQVTAQVHAGGKGVQAAVGLAAVNESVYAQREYQPGFARAYFILEEALQASGVSLPDESLSPASGAAAEEALRAAQQQAAKASWAGYQGQDFTLTAQSLDEAGRAAANRPRERAFQRLGVGLSLVLVILPLLMAVVVIGGLRHSGVLGRAAGRLLVAILGLAIVGAAVLFLTEALLQWLPPGWRMAVPAAIGLIWLLVLVGLAVYAWRQRDGRAQYVVLLLLSYAVLLGLLAFVAGQGGTPSAFWLLLLAAAFGLLLAALLLFGLGLRLEGERPAGLVVLLLALLILPLAVSLAGSGMAGADLIRQVAGPAVYGLHGGLLTGCAAPAPQMAAPAEAPAPAEKAAPPAPAAAESIATVVVEKEVEAEAMPQEQAVPTSVPQPPVEPTPAQEMMEVPAAEETAEEGAPRALAVPTTAPAAPGTEPAPVAPTEETVPTQPVAPAIAAAPPPQPAEEPAGEAPLPAPERAAPPTAQPTALVPTPTPPVTARAAQVTSPTPEPTPTPAPPAAPTSAPRPTVAPTPLPAAPSPTVTLSTDTTGVAGEERPQPTPLPPEALPIIRQRFPQTLYWNPQVVTDEDGFVQVTIPTGDEITTWRISALAVSPEGRLGSATAALVVFQPIFLEPEVPEKVAAGQQVIVPVRIFNYSAAAVEVSLTAQAPPGLALSVPALPVRVPPNDTLVVELSLRAQEPGRQVFTVIAQSESGVEDARQVTLDTQ